MGVLILTDFEVWVVLGVPVGGIGRDTVAQLQPRGKGVEPLPIVIIVVVVISVSRVVGLLIVYSMKYKYILLSVLYLCSASLVSYGSILGVDFLRQLATLTSSQKPVW